MALVKPAVPSNPSKGTAKVPLKSTCLFCSHPVLVIDDISSEAALEWSKLIKILSYHMQLDSREVPRNCTRTMFPLCKLCEQLAMNLYENQKKIDEAQRIISKTISTIERTVADAAILRASLPTGSISVEGEKLRETILDGYRSKLMMKAKLREQLILGTGIEGKMYDMPTCSHTVFMHDPTIRRQFSASRSDTSSSTFNSSQSSSSPRVPDNSLVNSIPGQEQTDNDDNKSAEPKPAENFSNSNSRPAQACDSNIHENQIPPALPNRSRACRKSTSAVPAASQVPGSPPSQLVANFNENSCTMTISSVRCGSASPTPDPSVMVKEEPGSPSATPAPVRNRKRKRRALFQGIEILKVSDPTTKKLYLQCSICRYPVLLSNPTNSDISPHQIMTQHITDRHLSRRRKAALQMMATSTPEVTPTPSTRAERKKEKQFTCKICLKVFTGSKALRDHKATHSAEEKTAIETEKLGLPPKSYYIPNLQCNICGRPIKGNLSNLIAHKFSHKNNEERREALANKEKGSRNALVRNLGAKASVPGVAKPEGSNRLRRAKKVRKGKVFPVATTMSRKKMKALILKEKPSVVDGTFHCRHCSKTFNRNCHFVLHMQMHFRRNKEVAVAKAAIPDPPSVLDTQVNGTEEVAAAAAETPQSFEKQPTNSADEVATEFSSEEIDNCLAETDNPNNEDEMQV